MDSVEPEAAKVEEKLGLPRGFFDSLEKEDDWSFVVKGHALLESACSEFLTERAGSAELIEIFTRLELSDKSRGKVAFMNSYGLLEQEDRRFISMFSELRNTLVHNVRNVTFTFNDYYTKLDKRQKKNFIDHFAYALIEMPEPSERAAQLFLKCPKKVLTNNLKILLSLINIQLQILQYRAEATEKKLKTMDLLLSTK